jgi:hypothetical protein
MKYCKKIDEFLIKSISMYGRIVLSANQIKIGNKIINIQVVEKIEDGDELLSLFKSFKNDTIINEEKLELLPINGDGKIFYIEDAINNIKENNDKLGFIKLSIKEILLDIGYKESTVSGVIRKYRNPSIPADSIEEALNILNEISMSRSKYKKPAKEMYDKMK